MHYIYLHGFASSPQSAKAQFLSDRFHQLGVNLIIPDLNQPDFWHLTLSRQIEQVAQLLPDDSAPVRLIGSSFGGLTAVWLAERYPQIQQLVLLAPAFQFLNHWLPKIGHTQLRQWQDVGEMAVYHYGEQQMRPLSYGFVKDALKYDETTLQRDVPTLILHGRQDDVIPIEASIQYAAISPWVKLVKLDSDHALSDVQDDIWQAIQQFYQLGEPGSAPAPN